MLSDTLLVTATELQAFQRNELSALDTDSYAEEMLAQAQGGLERYLGYNPFVNKITRFEPEWKRRVISEYVPYETLVYGAPVVQVDATDYESSSGYYTVAISADGFKMEVTPSNPLPLVVDVWAGWRSSNHNLDGSDSKVDLTELDGLDELSALPPEVPSLMKAALCNAAVYYARYAVKLGLNSYSVDLGAQVKQVETVIGLEGKSELEAIYSQCHKYRRFSV